LKNHVRRGYEQEAHAQEVAVIYPRHDPSLLTDEHANVYST